MWSQICGKLAQLSTKLFFLSTQTTREKNLIKKNMKHQQYLVDSGDLTRTPSETTFFIFVFYLII